jgi:hypothetical protein
LHVQAHTKCCLTIKHVGDDSDDFGHCETATSCNGLIVTIFQYAIGLSEVKNTHKDVLAIGVNGGQAQAALSAWQAANGFTVDVITADNLIMSTSFTSYKMIYLPSSQIMTNGGITCAQLDLLANRSSSIINFVNVHRGSLMALTHDGCPSKYAFLAAVLQTQSISISALYPTTDLLTIVPTLTSNSLDHCCYHTSYTGPVGYGGLRVMATDPGTGKCHCNCVDHPYQSTVIRIPCYSWWPQHYFVH